MYITVILALAAAALGASHDGPVRTAILSPGRLPWSASVHQVSAKLTKLGFRNCVVRDLEGRSTIGPSVGCDATDGRVGVPYRNSGEKAVIERFNFVAEGEGRCRALVEEAARAGYAWTEAVEEAGERVLQIAIPAGKPHGGWTFQLRPGCELDPPRLELTWAARPQ